MPTDDDFIRLEGGSLRTLDELARMHQLRPYLEGAISHVRNPRFDMRDFTLDRYRRVMTASIRVLRAMALAEGARWIHDNLGRISEVYATQIGLEIDGGGALSWKPVLDSPLLTSELRYVPVLLLGTAS